MEPYAAFLEANEAVQRTMFDTQYERKTPEDVYQAIDNISIQRIELLGSEKTKTAANRFGKAMVRFGEFMTRFLSISANSLLPERRTTPHWTKCESAWPKI